jgi:hypothetical protein
MENTPFPALESSGDPGDWKDVIGTMTLFGHLPVPADTETEMMFKFACKLKEGNDHANKFAAQNQQMVDLCEKILCSLGERNQREYREGVIALHELHNSVAGTWSGDDDSEATE